MVKRDTIGFVVNERCGKRGNYIGEISAPPVAGRFFIDFLLKNSYNMKHNRKKGAKNEWFG